MDNIPLSVWIPVFHPQLGEMGLTPNPASPMFDKMPKAMEGFVYFWIPGKCPRGETRESLVEVNWTTFVKRCLNDYLGKMDDTSVLLKMFNLICDEDLFPQVVAGASHEYAYDFAKWHNLLDIPPKTNRV